MKRLIGVMLFFVLVMGVQPSIAEDITLDVTATINIAATAAKGGDISFGSIIADPGGDTITVNASGTATNVTTTVTPTASNASTITGGNNGRIDVTTNINAVNVAIVYPATVTLTSGAETMTVGNIAANSTPTPQAIATAGTIYLHVGGELTIAANQIAGAYSGTMTVTLNYN